MQWYCVIEGQRQGPVDEAVLADWAREGRLKADDLVWNPTHGSQWVRAATALSACFTTPSLSVPGAPPGIPLPDPGSEFFSRTPNRDLMAQARAALCEHWWLGAGVSFVYMAILSAAGGVPCLGQLVNLMIAGPLSLGMAIFALAVARSKPLSMGQLFEGFNDFGTALAAYLLMAVFILLWCLLLIVPGIVAALAYSMTYFILRDHPRMDALDAIRLSRRMMYGNKWKYFRLQWRFFGWALLCLLTCGIGFFWLMPYVMTSNARFYDDLKAGTA